MVIYHADALAKDRLKFSVFKHRPIQNLAYGLMLFLLVTNSGDAGAFIYFQF